MKGSNKFLAGIVLGAAAGVVVALFLKSDKGKELVANIKEKAEDLANDLVEQGKSMINNTASNNTETTT